MTLYIKGELESDRVTDMELKPIQIRNGNINRRPYYDTIGYIVYVNYSDGEFDIFECRNFENTEDGINLL